MAFRKSLSGQSKAASLRRCGRKGSEIPERGGVQLPVGGSGTAVVGSMS